MAILAARYPDVIASGAEGGHGIWKVDIVAHEGGQETPVLAWDDAKGQWNVARAIENTGKHELARSHFYKCRGRYHHFRFKDWHDYKCDRTGIDSGALTGTTTTWQINKVYGTDEPSFEYVRPLKRIVNGTVQIWVDGVLQTLTTHYTVNHDTGIVTSLASWAAAYTLEVSCEFDVLCRYDVERFAARLIHRRNSNESFFSWDDIDIVEVREEEA